MKELWINLIRLLFTFQFKYDIYSRLSGIVAYLRDKKYIAVNHVDYSAITSFESLTAALKMVRWAEDKWKFLTDTIAAPERVQYVIDTGNQFKNDMDCDEFSIYAGAILHFYAKHSTQREFSGIKLINTYMMSVIYMHGWAQRGHNVCVFTYYDENQYLRYGCISNWDRCEPMLDFLSLHDVVDYVCGLDDFVIAQLLTVYRNGEPGYRVSTKAYMLLDDYNGEWKTRGAA